MSLDFSLYIGDERIEDCPHCDGKGKINRGREEVCDENITHNLNRMADAAGIYDCLWRPEEHGIVKASQMIEPLRAGLQKLQADPAHFRQFDAPNGWGKYEHFVPFVSKILSRCEEYPDADVRAWR